MTTLVKKILPQKSLSDINAKLATADHPLSPFAVYSSSGQVNAKPL